MPAFNCEDTIADSIRSVLSQDFTDFELLLIDDCSNDSTSKIIRDFCKSDTRLVSIQLAVNGGAGKARNVGIERASGRYIAFLDSDDLWYEQKLSIQIQYMRESNIAFSCTWFDVSELSSMKTVCRKPPARISYEDLLKENIIGCLTVVYDTSIVGKCFMPELRKRQDYALWLQLLKKTDLCGCVPLPLALYRQRSGSVSSNKLAMVRYNFKVFREIEGMSVHRSLQYLGLNVIKKITQMWK
jgi:glycosyltransferase involved in cell wall biosynthesis